MNTIVKVLVASLLIGGIYYAVAKAARQLTSGLSYRIVGIGIPSLSGTTLVVPITLQFINETPIPISVDSLDIVVYLLSGSQYKPAGQVHQQQLRIGSGESDVKFNPTIDLKSVSSNALQTVLTTLQNQYLSLKAEITVTVQGYSVSESLTKQVKLG